MVLLPDTDQAVIVMLNAGNQFELGGANAAWSRIPQGVVNLLRDAEPPTGTGAARFFNAVAAVAGLAVLAGLARAVRLVRASSAANANNMGHHPTLNATDPSVTTEVTFPDTIGPTVSVRQRP
jgi:hypothetical protein